MKHFIFWLLLVAATGSQAQKAAPTTRFYLMTGKIDKYPVTFLLHRINSDFSGVYYYHSSASPIGVSGKIGKDGILKLQHFARDEKNNENIEGDFKDNNFSGTWQSKGKTLTIQVSEQKEGNPLQFDYIWTEGTKKLKNKPEHLSHIDGISYEGRSVWPVANSNHPANQKLQQVIRALFGVKEGSDEVGQIMLRRKNKFLATPEDSIELYEESDALDVAYVDDKLISFSQTWSNYGGGAHGNYGIQYFNVDLKNIKEITLADIMDTLAAKSTVEKLLEKAFRKDFPFDEGETLKDVLFDEKITATENFMLTSKGITFNYEPYEIAAYAYGQIALYISYKDLQPYLKPGFKKLVGL
jgi:hypothetical protein